MKIQSVHAFLMRIPLEQPYAIAYQSIVDTEIIYFTITLENGLQGYGASNPFPEVIGETPAVTLSNLQSAYMQSLIGENIDNVAAILLRCTQHFPHMPGTLAAIDIALHDAYCKYYNKRVVDYYGQQVHALPTSITIGIKAIAAMLEDAKKYYAKGFRILKIKTGISVEEDISRVHYLTEAFGNKVKIRVDANAGYNMHQLQQFLQATQHLPLELIEQPLAVGSDALLNAFPISVKQKLVADESLTDIASAERILQHPMPFGVFNIKLMKAGGIKAAHHIAGLAAQQNVSVFWGCNDESIISIAAALHIAYACPNTRYLDLDGSFEVIEPLVNGGFRLINGEMHLLPTPGLGVQLKTPDQQ